MQRLAVELKQSKPFRNVREEGILNIWRTGDLFAARLEQLLNTHGLTRAQYNSLRILRGAGDEGIPSGEIAGRLLTKSPDVTRLLDRLVHGGLARRVRVRQDRRVVLAKITPRGLDLLRKLEIPVAQLIDKSTAHITDSQFRTLIRVLERLRQELP